MHILQISSTLFFTIMFQSISTSTREDLPFQTTSEHTAAGEIQILGIAHITYEKFIFVLLLIIIGALIARYTVKKYYHPSNK